MGVEQNLEETLKDFEISCELGNDYAQKEFKFLINK
jgi:hypothetical protein